MVDLMSDIDLATTTTFKSISDAGANDIDEDVDDERDVVVPVFSEAHASGILYKWTNYVLGWQQRYFELENGVLVYYKTKAEKQFGSRGSVTVRCALIAENEVDACRFDVATNNVIWYLRAENTASKNVWLSALRSYSRDSGYCSPSDRISNASACSTSSLLIISGELRERVDQLKHNRELALKQLDRIERSIQAIVLSSSSRQSRHPHYRTPNSNDTVIADASLQLKTTTSAIVNDITACINILNSQVLGTNTVTDEMSQMKLDTCATAATSSGSSALVSVSQNVTTFLSDDEEQDWYDARDASTLTTNSDAECSSSHHHPILTAYMDEETTTVDEMATITPSGILTLPKSHFLSSEIERITMEQLRYAKAGVEDQVWQLFSEEGEMKMYKREVEIDGLVCDPLKATHTVKGISAREFIHFFYEPEYKLTWDDTVEKVNVVEKVSDDTVVLHQIHKKVWPAAQRESLFWSHVRQMNSFKDPDAYDLFMVCNHDCERPDVPLRNPSNVRVGLTIAMVCETVIRNGCSKARHQLTRDDIYCRVIYVAQIHPGGWVPSSALRVVYKREYPKFLRGFTKYVVNNLKSRQLCI